MENALSFGVDIGGSRCKVALVARDGGVVAREIISMVDYARSPNYPKFVASLCECILRLYSAAGCPSLSGIGVGAPNANGSAGQIVNPVNLWRDDSCESRVYNIVEDIRLQLSDTPLGQTQVQITNDVNAAALGELYFGEARGMSDIVVVAIGTGLGGGIITNGRLVEGRNGAAGEIGHLNVVENGRVCGCGLRGCLETYVSDSGICKTYIELGGTANEKIFSAKDVCQAAMRGDVKAIEAFHSAGRMLGRSLAGVVQMLAPEAIFLTGGVAKAGHLLLDAAKNALGESLPPQCDVDLRLSEMNDDFAAARGAAVLCMKNYLDKARF